MNLPKSLLSGCQKIDLWSDSLWVSIPTANPIKALYFSKELTEDEQLFAAALAASTSGIDTSDGKQKDRWYQYGDLQDLDFCFSALSFPPSRFSDGTYPVWYASDSQDGSKAEVTYHCLRQAALELQYTKQENMLRFERAFCKARVKSSGYDLRRLAETKTGLLENGPPYPYCNEVGSIDKKSVKCLVSMSRRLKGAELWGVFEREPILESRVKAFWYVEVHKNKEANVCGTSIEFSDGWYRELDH